MCHAARGAPIGRYTKNGHTVLCMPAKQDDGARGVRVRRETYALLHQIAEREERALCHIVDRAVRYYGQRHHEDPALK